MLARAWSLERGEAGLSALLVLQALTLFVAVPLSALHPAGRILFDVTRLAFALVSITLLTRRRTVQIALLAGIVTVALGPWLRPWLDASFGVEIWDWRQAVAFIAFSQIGLITILVGLRVFGPGRVTVHRIRGAVLIFLNVAALFAIAYAELLSLVPDAIVFASGHLLPSQLRDSTAELTYFSLATITTTGYGDLVPLHPLARSLTNLESVFGQLFPATLLARLVALQLAHNGDGR